MATFRASGLSCVVCGVICAAAVAGAAELIRAMPLSGVASLAESPRLPEIRSDEMADPALPPVSENPRPVVARHVEAFGSGATAGLSSSAGNTVGQASSGTRNPGRDGLLGSRPAKDLGLVLQPATPASEFWAWQILPDGLLYRSYLAGGREPRFGAQWVHARGWGWLWDSSLGGRVGMLRWGTLDPLWPEGWQIDIEGAAFPRLTLEENRDLVSADYRFGIPITMRRGRFEAKAAFYHLSSHLGDEYGRTHPWIERINFSRDVFVLGAAVYPWPSVRTYAEMGWAFYCDGGTEPWEFQFGVDCSPPRPSGLGGDPFLAVNGHLRQEVDFGGSFTLQTGWQWRGSTGRLTRLGFHYFNGQSEQYQFFRQHEQQIGVGLWYDY